MKKNKNNSGGGGLGIIIFIIIIIAAFSGNKSSNEQSQKANIINNTTSYKTTLNRTTTVTATPKVEQITTNDENSETVYVTRTGSKYHKSGCSYLKSKYAITKADAIEQGYTPCSRCKP